MRSLISKAFAATLLLVSLVTAFADDDLEEFEEVVEEIFEELDEELDELLDQFRDSDEDFNELVEEFDEEFDDEFHELAEELQELATPFTGVESLVSQGAPLKMWVSDGILHVRSQPGLTSFVGTIDGTSLTWTNEPGLNLNLNLATGDGNAYITGALDVTWGDLRGAFDVRGTFEITAFSVLLRFVGLGDGVFEGMIIMGTATGILGASITHEGIILNLEGDGFEDD